MACRLDSLACQEAISDMFLNAIDGCSEDLQREIITLLPELLSENAHEVFPSAYASLLIYISYLAPIHALSRRTKGCNTGLKLEAGAAKWQVYMQTCPLWLAQAFVQKLEELCEANGTFLLPSLEAFATLCLTDDLQVLYISICMGCRLTSAWPDQPSIGSHNHALVRIGCCHVVCAQSASSDLDQILLSQEKVVDLILGRLESAPVTDLPAMLQHLLQSVSQANARQVTHVMLRTYLELLLVSEFLLMHLWLAQA